MKAMRFFPPSKFAILVLSAFMLTYACAHHFRAVNVGDGSEYYAMEIAWAKTHKPYMNADSWASYGDFVSSNSVSGLEPEEQLRNKFPALRRGNTADFNHFWAYPLAASVFELAFPGHIHAAFLLLHSALLSFMLAACWKLHGKSGLITAFVLVAFSPTFWFINKVHTEWWTVTLTISAVAAATQKKWSLAALLLSIVSTQNISFALPAGACWVFALFASCKARTISLLELICLVASAGIVLLHPIYYMSRYGVLTPQLLAGGANLKGHFNGLYYIFDPDIGLLPNWPVGILILLSSFYVLFKNKEELKKIDTQVALLVITYLGATLYAHGASENMNSGATVYVSRYALWYIPVFYFPLRLLIQRALGARHE